MMILNEYSEQPGLRLDRRGYYLSQDSLGRYHRA